MQVNMTIMEEIAAIPIPLYACETYVIGYRRLSLPIAGKPAESLPARASRAQTVATRSMPVHDGRSFNTSLVSGGSDSQLKIT